MNVGCLTQTPTEKLDYKVPIEEPVICILNKQKRRGVLKFIGETEFSSGVWCGIALHEACGKNDGSVAGVRYFECDQRHGIFVNPKNVFHAATEDDQKPPQGSNIVVGNLNGQEHEPSDGSFDEGRPRSKSEVVMNEKNDYSNVFSNSPFKCNIRNTKSSSLSKLNNETYICSSPIFDGTDSTSLGGPTQTSPLSDTSPKVCDGQKNEEVVPGCVTSKLHHHTDLSPKFEVKQSIKLGSIPNTARFPAPAALGRDQDLKLNKTFLVCTEKHGIEKESCEEVKETRSDSKERSAGDNNDQPCQETLASSTNQENLNATFVSTNESDAENGRPRSASKSSCSSIESFSSIGSAKSNKERSRLNGTKTPRKLPCPTKCSKSKLVKICTEKKQKPKEVDGEATAATNKGKVVLKSAAKPVTNDVNIVKKNRTKSTSIVAPRSGIATPSVSNSAVKTKSKSVSSDFRDGQSLSRSRLNSSKFATPLASKSSAPPASRLTSTPVGKKPTGLESRTKITSASVTSRTSCARTLSENFENKQKCISRENSNVENKVSSLQVKNKHSSSIVSTTKEKENKPDISRSRNLSTSVTSKKPLTTKSRTLSTSAALKSECKTVASRARNLSTSCTAKDSKPAAAKLRQTSTSKVDGGIAKSNGLKSSLKSPSLGRVSESLSTSSSKSLPRKTKAAESLSFKDRQNSDEAVKKRSAKEKLELTNAGLRNLSAAATPDILKQTPEVTRHSVAVQVDTLQHDEQERTQISFEEHKKTDALLAAFVKRNRDFEASLVALQVYAKKVDHERQNSSLLRKNLKFTKERYHSTENMLVKESSQRARLEEEMLSAKSDSVVEVALLRAEYERKQEIMQAKLKDIHKKDLEKGRKQHIKAMEDVKHSCDLKLKRIEETYVEDIAQINEKHRDVVADLESQHSKHIDDLVEERHAEIEAIKADYDEQLERLQENVSKTEKTCNEVEEKLRICKDEAKRDIDLRIQDAIAKYKSLPDELESMKFVLEMKNTEVKKLRISNAELQHQIDHLQQIKERAALLEREKESLNFVVENKSHFERQLSLERDKLRLSLDREVATSKRLSLEKEELAWRLNSFQNSPTSPTISTDRFNWRTSGFNSPDSAVYSQKIEESDFEYQINDTKEIES